MKKIILFITIIFLSCLAQSQTRSWKMYPNDWTYTYSYQTGDNVIASVPWSLQVRSTKVVGLKYSVTVLVHKNSGAPNGYIGLFGKINSTDAWTEIDSTLYTDSGADSICTFKNSSTYSYYNYWLVKLTPDATTQSTKIKSIAITFSGDYGQSGAYTTTSATPVTFTSQVLTKGLNFTGVKMIGGAANGAFTYGTWSTPVWNTALAGHYVPIQVNIHNSVSGSYDVAAARFRVDADADTANTLTAVNVIEGRSALYGTIGAHSGINMSTNIGGNLTCTGDLVPMVAKIEGTGNITCSNHVTPFYATVTATGSGIDDVSYFDANGSTVTDGIKIETHNSATVTNMLNIANTSGTVTTGIALSGTLANDITTTSGAKIFSGTAANETAVYAEVGAKDATGSIYISTAGAIFIQVANNGADADWNLITSAHH